MDGDSFRAPLLAFAAAFLVGLSLGWVLLPPPLPLLVVLGGASLSLAGRPRAWMGGIALGFLLAALEVSALGGWEAVRGLELSGRPVRVVATAGAWSPQPGGWTTELRRISLWAREPIGEEGRAATGWRPVRRQRSGLRLTVTGPTPPCPEGGGLRARGRLVRTPAHANGWPVPPGPWRLRVASTRLVDCLDPPGFLARWVTTVRSRMRTVLEPTPETGETTGPGRRLAAALLLGERDTLAEAWIQGLRTLGLLHVLAVSGLHMGLAAAIASALAAPLPSRLRWILTAGVLLAYVLVTGLRPSGVRAALMAWVALVGLAAGRPSLAANSLAVAVLCQGALDPGIVRDPGFQLSTAATAGILFLGLPLAARLPERRWLPAWLRSGLGASFGAQAGAAPIALRFFPMISPASLVLNLAVVPWVGGFLALAAFWLLVSILEPSFGRSLETLLDLAARPLLALAEGGRGARLLTPVPWARSSTALAALVAALVGLAWALAGRKRGAVAWIVCAGATCLVAVAVGSGRSSATGATVSGSSQGGAELIVFDVGQGESLLLRDGPANLLVDGGGWERGDFGGRVLLPALLAEGIRELDAVLVTHPDVDHCHGLRDVARYLPLRRVYASLSAREDPCVEGLARASVRGLEPLGADRDLHVGRWRLRVLQAEADAGWSKNDRSLVLEAAVFGRRLLLTGDLGRQGEERLLRRLPGVSRNGRLDVLKVAHHGSATATGRPFLARTRPRLALVSAGRNNRYGHPAPAVVERLRRVPTPLLSTAELGMLRLRFEKTGAVRVDWPAVEWVDR